MIANFGTDNGAPFRGNSPPLYVIPHSPLRTVIYESVKPRARRSIGFSNFSNFESCVVRKLHLGFTAALIVARHTHR